MLNKIDVGTIVGRNQEVINSDHWHAIISIPTCLFAMMCNAFQLEDWGKDLEGLRKINRLQIADGLNRRFSK